MRKVSKEIEENMKNGRIDALAGCERAVWMRNIYLEEMRAKTSPIGLLIARWVKPAGGTANHYLNMYAKRRFQLNFDQINREDKDKRNLVCLRCQFSSFYLIAFRLLLML